LALLLKLGPIRALFSPSGSALRGLEGGLNKGLSTSSNSLAPEKTNPLKRFLRGAPLKVAGGY